MPDEATVNSVNYWSIAILVYVILAAVTFLPVLRILLKPVALNPGGPSFDESPSFTDKAKLKLQQHFDRLRGTLSFWKNQAEKYRAFHRYCLCWSITAGVLVPFLAQAIGSDGVSKWLVTIVSAHAALMLGFSKGFRVEQNYKAFRQGESEFYDLYRRFLDSPTEFGETEDEQLDTYFAQVNFIRKIVRSAEIDNIPAIEEASAKAIQTSKKIPRK